MNPFEIPNHKVTFVIPDGQVDTVGIELECLPNCDSPVYQDRKEPWPDETSCRCTSGPDGGQCDDCKQAEHESCDEGSIPELGATCRLDVSTEYPCWPRHMLDAISKETFVLVDELRFTVFAHLSGGDPEDSIEISPTPAKTATAIDLIGEVNRLRALVAEAHLIAGRS